MTKKIKLFTFDFVPPAPLPPSPLSEKSVIALLKLKAFLQVEPRRYYQGAWIVDVATAHCQELDLQNPPCGTTFCLGGGACLMEGWVPIIGGDGGVDCVKKYHGRTSLDVDDCAQEILGLTHSQCLCLFHYLARGWWSPAKTAFTIAQDKHDYQGAVNAATMQIDHLIETGYVGSSAASDERFAGGDY
jgi:hypothetical protein